MTWVLFNNIVFCEVSGVCINVLLICFNFNFIRYCVVIVCDWLFGGFCILILFCFVGLYVILFFLCHVFCYYYSGFIVWEISAMSEKIVIVIFVLHILLIHVQNNLSTLWLLFWWKTWLNLDICKFSTQCSCWLPCK